MAGGATGAELPRSDVLPPGFSNGHGTYLSSPGLFIAESIVPSQFGTRLRLFGVCRGMNDNSDARLIGMHPYRAPFFVPDTRGRPAGIATSQGCPAVSEGVAREIMPMLDGGFLYIHHPDHTPRGFTASPAQSSRHARVR